MEEQVKDHNSERINTKLLSLRSNLNYSYGLVMRILYLLKNLSLGKHESRRIKVESIEVFQRQP